MCCKQPDLEGPENGSGGLCEALGSQRRVTTKQKLAVVQARDTARRKDWIEKATTNLARRFDTVVIEDLRIKNMTRSAKGTVAEPGTGVAQKRGLNRSILEQGWGLFARRLADKIGDRLVLVPAAYTSQRCSCCGHVDNKSRESQSRFACTACGHADHADVNAALNILAHGLGRRQDLPRLDGRGQFPPLLGLRAEAADPSTMLVEAVVSRAS